MMQAKALTGVTLILETRGYGIARSMYPFCAGKKSRMYCVSVLRRRDLDVVAARPVYEGDR